MVEVCSVDQGILTPQISYNMMQHDGISIFSFALKKKPTRKSHNKIIVKELLKWKIVCDCLIKLI